MISLTTRPLAWGGKVWAHTYNDLMFTVTNVQTVWQSWGEQWEGQ